MHILSLDDIPKSYIEDVIKLANKIKKQEIDPEYDWNWDSPRKFRGVLGNLFFSPSTRTRVSFEVAMKKLGGEVVNVTDPNHSSVAKGETIGDTIRTFSQYVDVIVLRQKEFSAKVLGTSNVPIINAGDKSEHPTQAMIDLFTIIDELGTVDGLNIFIYGDLEQARTIKSFKKILENYDVNINERSIILPENSPSYYDGPDSEIQYYLKMADVVYMTRIQSECYHPDFIPKPRRNDSLKREEYGIENHLKDNAILLHPFPRGDELIATLILDNDPRAAYFRQMKNGMYVRMALLKMALGHI